MDAITIEGLCKSFKSGWPGRPSIEALRGLSLAVGAGEIYGFLGPNGSGKTTTLKILMGLMRADAGTAQLLGQRAGTVEIRRRIGFLPEGPYFYDYLTAEEFLTFYGQLAGMSGTALVRRIDELLGMVALQDARQRQLRKFSKGMLQRVGLAQAIIHDPELVILDEPMSGLDPVGRKQVRDLILSLRDQGKTVFFSSHIIPDVEMICDRVGIILQGRLVASGTVEELVSKEHTQSVEILCEAANVREICGSSQTVSRIVEQGRRTLIVLKDARDVGPVAAAILAKGGTLISIVPEKRSLEDLFLKQSINR
jgi:ABC-2 type transport system ATP-binding protein